ncbi:hypothetical protein CK203_025943 [Vitis vinifera]|uniref:Uncharacterized protein n=1 Tax=Vitis vinifera TaxID=29760 RepID=A0A438IKT0_VITVI|nr:hypothetical protein CK203_025943 [Vitis vinifera]
MASSSVHWHFHGDRLYSALVSDLMSCIYAQLVIAFSLGTEEPLIVDTYLMLLTTKSDAFYHLKIAGKP